MTLPSKELYCGGFTYTIKGVKVYMSEHCAKDLVAKLNNGEVIL